MTSDKRPTSSTKRGRSRRKQRAAALRAATRVSASQLTPEGDKPRDKNNPKSDKSESQEPVLLVKPNGSSDKTTNDDGLDKGLVFVCRPTLPDFCSLFVPWDDAQSVTRVDAAANAATCKTFTVRVPSFRETREGFVTYALELATCDLSQQTFQLERRFSEFVACAAELTKQQQLHITSQEEEKKDGEGETLEGCFQWHLPAKTWFRVTNLKALEDRRVQLEQALETLLQQRDGRMCNLPVVRDFLMLDIFGVQVAEQKTLQTAAQVEG